MLSIGETVEEVTDSGFLGTTPTLSCSQLGDDALVQVCQQTAGVLSFIWVLGTFGYLKKDSGKCLGKLIPTYHKDSNRCALIVKWVGHYIANLQVWVEIHILPDGCEILS